ncbi:pectinesterase family protein [Aggregatilinea lenta]|uniref:pectinesterase family protein n=1 Tax=Aggregatilinea lenta TaxID=913108 RepID=UPI000E5A33BF|nr:pectinesterase family protein [Aggregatilinea lenta]
MAAYTNLRRYHPPLKYINDTVVVDAAGSGDYTSIKSAVQAVTPRFSRRKKIYVSNGTYNEIQIDGKNWLTIEGESLDGVIMVSDGTRTDIDPVSGQRYVDMSESDKHGWRIYHQMTIRNMTIRVNDVKYCIHSDSAYQWTLALRNVHFEHSNGFTLGIGLHAHQHITCTDCIFEHTGSPTGTSAYGVFCHNWNNQIAPSSLALTNCQSVSCGLLNLSELGSEQEDLISLINCSTEDSHGIYYSCTDYYWDGGGQGVANVPYSFRISIENPGFPLPIVWDAEARPELMDYVAVT